QRQLPEHPGQGRQRHPPGRPGAGGREREHRADPVRVAGLRKDETPRSGRFVLVVSHASLDKIPYDRGQVSLTSILRTRIMRQPLAAHDIKYVTYLAASCLTSERS